jgi:hypothetical protein
VAWPVAVVAESPDGRSVTFRTYCSQWPIGEPRIERGPDGLLAAARGYDDIEPPVEDADL